MQPLRSELFAKPTNSCSRSGEVNGLVCYIMSWMKRVTRLCMG